MPKLLPLAKVFISSTFADMQVERDILCRLIMPPLRDRMMQRGMDIREIDLRWGVTQTMAQGSGAVGICLDGVEECSPFFLGMLGHRYGWVLEKSEIEKFGPTRSLPAVSNCSLTELEIRHALHIAKSASAFKLPLMFRSRRLSEELGFVDQDPEGLRAAEALRKELGDHPDTTVLPYDSFQEFEDRLRDALSSMFDTASIEQLEAAGARSHANGVARPDITRALDKYGYMGKPMLIFGTAGSGKSAVLEQWGEDHARIMRFDGRKATLTQIVEDLTRGRGVVSEQAPGLHLAADALEELGKRPGKDAVIIDHLEASGLTQDHVELSWLPSRIEKGLALIVATSNERLLEQAEELGWDIIEMPPPERDLSQSISAQYLSEYGKYLDETQANTLLGAPWTCDLSSMLLVLGELRRYGSFETLDERLLQLAKIDDPITLIEEVIAGIEQSLPPEWSDCVRAIVVSIAISWRGLSADEICQLAREYAGHEEAFDLPPATFAVIRIGLGPLLTERGNRIDLQQGPAEDWVDHTLNQRPGLGESVADALERSFLRFRPNRASEEYPRLALFREGRSGLLAMLRDPVKVNELEASAPGAILPLLEALDEGELCLLEQSWQDPVLSEDERDALQKRLKSFVQGDDEVVHYSDLSTQPGIEENAKASLKGDKAAIQRLIEACFAAAQGHVAISQAPADSLIAALSNIRASRRDLTQSTIMRSLLAEGSLARVRGQAQDALKRLAEAESYARREGLVLPLCRALCEQSRAAIELHKFRLARTKAQDALKLARGAHIARLEALAMDACIEVEHRRANYKEAYELADEYMQRAQQGDVSPFRARRALDRLEAAFSED